MSGELVATLVMIYVSGVALATMVDPDPDATERDKHRRAWATMATCPTPIKVRYRTKPSAIAAAIRTSREFGPLRVYRCPCGGWHLTRKRRR